MTMASLESPPARPCLIPPRPFLRFRS